MTASFLPADWPAPARVGAGVSLRRGGVSRGAYAELNLALHVGDDAGDVAENRRRLAAAASLPGEPVWLEQVHGAEVAALDAGLARDGAEPAHRAEPMHRVEPMHGAEPAHRATATVDTGASRGLAPLTADAAFTRRAGVVCAVQTADCLPVLVTDRRGSVVGAAHAGWRGLASGVIAALVQAMQAEGAALIAWLGPAIGAAAYEVGDDVRDAMTGALPGAASAFAPNARGRWQADLYTLARLALAEAGVADVYGGGYCTRTQAEKFFSHRREAPCGRMASLIWLEPSP